MSIPFVTRFQNNQQTLIQDIKTCYEDLIQLRKASDLLINKKQHTIQHNAIKLFALTENLVKLIESADHDIQNQAGCEKRFLGVEGDMAEDLALRTEYSKSIAAKYHQDFSVITEGFAYLARSSKATLEDAKGLSRNATVFQVVRVAGIEQQRQVVLKDLQEHILIAKQKVDILTMKQGVIKGQVALASQKASNSGQEASRQDNNRDIGITTGAVSSGVLGYAAIGVGVCFGPVGWIVGGIVAASTATGTAIYASEKKERIQRLENEQRSHQRAAAELQGELSQTSSTIVALEVNAVECKNMGQQLVNMEKDVGDLRQSAAKYEDKMKGLVINSTNTYLKMSQTAIRMLNVGYSSDIRAELLEIVSGVCTELDLLGAGLNQAARKLQEFSSSSKQRKES